MKIPTRAPALVALLAAVACATPAPAVHEGHAPVPSPDATVSSPVSDVPITADPSYSDGDVRFMQSMIAHHEQALVITAMVPERTETRAIHLIAERIAVSQRDEIARMAKWLADRGEEVPGTMLDHAAQREGMRHDPATHARHQAEVTRHAGMPGMLTPAQLAELEAATGADFDRLFLDLMIQHHQGALTMVAELFASPSSGQEPEVFQLASDVDSDQRMEIERMYRLRRSLD